MGAKLKGRSRARARTVKLHQSESPSQHFEGQSTWWSKNQVIPGLGQKVLVHENAWFQVAPGFTCFFRPMWTAPEPTTVVMARSKDAHEQELRDIMLHELRTRFQGEGKWFGCLLFLLMQETCRRQRYKYIRMSYHGSGRILSSRNVWCEQGDMFSASCSRR
jgi:hypothetical protein